MPTYEYQCDECNYKFDEVQRFSEDALKECPKCKKEKLRRLFSCGAGFIFKGSGFYQNDYKGKNASLNDCKQIANRINEINGENKS